MSLTLYYHPLSSFCWKVLIALHENGTPFKPVSVDLGDPGERAALSKLWPVGKFPVLRDDARSQTVPESSIIIDYLDRFHPGGIRFTPADGDTVWQARLKDRFYDLYVHLPTQAIVGHRLRPANAKDPHGVEEAKARLRASFDMIEAEMAGRTWATGESFTIADCAASPSLYYADKVLPFRGTHRHVAAYLDRLMARPAFARVLEEAKPYAHLFPEE